MADVEIIFPDKKLGIKPFALVNLAVTVGTALFAGGAMLLKVRGRACAAAQEAGPPLLSFPLSPARPLLLAPSLRSPPMPPPRRMRARQFCTRRGSAGARPRAPSRAAMPLTLQPRPVAARHAPPTLLLPPLLPYPRARSPGSSWTTT